MAHRPTRRQMLQASLAGAFSLAGASARAGDPGRGGRKPNLLLLWTDEQRPDTMAVYGNRRIHAPNLNKLAAQSVVFRNAYDTQPVCTPARSSVMTGLWPHTSGCTNNNIPLPTDIPCLPEIINDPDYRTAYMGKWHLGDEIYAQHGFQEWVSIEDTYSQYYSESRDRNDRSSYHRFLLDRGYEPGENGKFGRGFAARLPIEHCKPKFLELEACKFLRRHRNEPFLLSINFLEPHMPFFGPLDNEHDPAEIELPANFNDPLEPNEPLRYRAAQAYWRREYPTEQSWRELIAKYWGLVTQVDRSVGAILAALDDLGLSDNTIVAYTSDHGDMMGAHQMLTKGVMYEESVRVPWLLRIPERSRRPLVIDDPVSHIDLVPTLLELMSAQCDQPLPGRSLLPRIDGSPLGEDHVFIQWNSAGGGVRGGGDVDFASRDELRRAGKASVRTVVAPDGWKLSLSDLDKSQLFHLKRDPGETTNLFDSGQHDDVIRRLTARIHEWQESVKDPLQL